MGLIEIPVLHSKLSSVSAEKRSYVIILIAVLKAVELSNTPMQDNAHRSLFGQTQQCVRNVTS